MSPLKDIKCFLLDMDGTFYLGDRIIPGSLEFIDKVVSSGRDFLFLTNNSSHNAPFYVKRLEKMGLSVTRDKILTSGEAACDYLNSAFQGKRVFCLGNEFLKQELTEAGIVIDESDPDLVLIGFDTTLDYKKMCTVCDLVRAGLPYVATHPDYNCPTETGFIPDIGAIIAFIEASAARRPDVIIGKPYSGIVDAALKRTGCSKAQLAMVGDRLYTDIKTGNVNEMMSILVMSGETTPAMAAESPIKPTLSFDRLYDMVPLL
jgi:HAD superfamily hydrolase (TIGR01457 family)